ncbi:DsbA family protein [Rhodovulum sp. YNF3179]|uniref:DsbA family protein n=1 Tax=Rhodovulum sp. YNF3179 TaxID=3425127 RepID=UPI003D34FEC8
MARNSLFALVAAVLVAGGALWALQGGQPATTPIPAANAQSSGDVDTSGIAEMTVGDPEAPVEVIEYASFTCPHCATFHETVFPQIEENYVDTGKVHFVYREVYFDRYGLWAGMVARCGGADRYFGIVDMIYERQREWTQGEDAAQVVQNLRKIGKVAGLDDSQLDACLSDAGKAEALYALYQKNAEMHDINSTPSFVIDGEKFSNMSYADFAETLDEKLAE